MEKSRVTPLRLDREDEKKMLPCRFFANGYCHKGHRCRFFHPLHLGLVSMIRVPPLPPHFGGPHHEMNTGMSQIPVQPIHYFEPRREMKPQAPPKQEQQQQPPQPQQNTVFSHIDWSEFLAPGQNPPPPTRVPDDRHIYN